MSVLSAADQQKVQAALHQWIVKQSKAIVTFNGSVKASSAQSVTQLQAVILLSEHMVLIFEIGKKSARIVKWMHIFDVLTVDFTEADRIYLISSEMEIEIAASGLDRFVRELVKIIQFSAALLPVDRRCRFETKNVKLGRVQRLIPTQKFQLGYAAYCSYFAQDPKCRPCRYSADVASYYHAQLAYRNFSFDVDEVQHLSKKPLAGYRALMAAYCHVRFCPVFSIHGQSAPDLLMDAALMVRESRNLCVLSVVDVGATVGGEQLGFALNQDVCPLVFLDISGNKLSDAGKFAQALETCSARLQGLVLNGMNLDDTTIAQLFNALTKNRSLFGLQELSIIGSRINAKNCRLAEAWLGKLAQVPYVTQITRVLSLGPVAAVPLITNKIMLTKLQFGTLRLVDSVLDDANLGQLVKSGGIQRLLDLSRSSIKEQDFLQLVTAIGNRKDPPCSLVLSGMFPRGRSHLLLAGLDKCKLQLHELVLDGNNLVPDDLQRLIQVLSAAPNLRKLSLCGMFSAKQEGVGTMLRSLVELTNIEALAIAGDGTPGLQREAIPLLCGLFAANRMKMIDFRQNRIGDVGLLTLANFVRASQTLERVFVDDTGARDLLSLRTFMDACAGSSSLIEAPFPAADFVRLVGEKKGGDGVVEAEFLLLRGRVNVRLCNNRYLRTPRVTSALLFRTDPLLSKLILNITRQTNQVYSAYRIQHFETLDDEDKVWAAEKWMGVDAPIARIRDAEADTRVKARREQRLAGQRKRDGSKRGSGSGSYMDSDDLMSSLTQRSNDSSDADDTSGSVSSAGTRQQGPPSFGSRPGVRRSPPATVQQQRQFVKPPAKAIPKLPNVTRINEPDLGFMDVWPIGIDDSVSDSQALNDPSSLCPRPLL